MADIQNYEPLWGEWRSVKLLSRGTCEKVYLAEKTQADMRYYAVIKHIVIAAEPVKQNAAEDDGGAVSSGDYSTSDIQQELGNIESVIGAVCRLKGSPNIVSYEEYQVFPQNDECGYDVFIRMEQLFSLKDYIKQRDITVADAVQLGADICAGLTQLRQEYVIHGDINPGSIFVDNNGNYKLGGFGLPRLKSGRDMDYVAPEVAGNIKADRRADLYSLGLVLYTLMNNNRVPFLPSAPNPVTQKMKNAAQKRRLQGEKLLPPVLADKNLSNIILKACTHDVEHRWDSPDEMRLALTAYRMSLETVTAGQVVFERTQKAEATGYMAASVKRNTAAVVVKPDKETGKVKSKPTKKSDLKEQPESPCNDTSVIPPTELTEVSPAADEEFNGAPISKSAFEYPLENTEVKQQIGKQKQKERRKKKGFLIVAAVLIVASITTVILVTSPWGLRGQTIVDGGISTTQQEPSVSALVWQDPVIEAGVCKALGITKGTIDPSVLAGLQKLTLTDSDEPISTLADLEKMPNLKFLELNGHPVKTFDFPDSMSEILTLNIKDCGCSDLSFLENPSLKSLINLDISDNPVQDLKPVAFLKSLKTLTAKNIEALDWSPVDGVDKVEGRPVTPVVNPTPQISPLPVTMSPDASVSPTQTTP